MRWVRRHCERCGGFTPHHQMRFQQPEISWGSLIVLSVLTGGLFSLLRLAVWMGSNDSWGCSYCMFVLCELGGKCPPEKLLGRRR